MTLTETAYAKINLALHVRRRREDGYHELETLFAFVDGGDRLAAEFAGEDRITVSGEFAGALDNPFDNILAHTLTKFPRGEGWHVHLEKNLPVAAGLGGGSADAGALIRMIAEAQSVPNDVMQRAAALGADVPACVWSDMKIGRGTGTELERVDNDLKGTPILLVNPRVPVPTGPVFKAWAKDGKGKDGGALPTGSAREIATNGRNDLEAPAIAICPPVADILAALADTAPWLARMSGSGATCFALYADTAARDAAAADIAARQPDWWQMTGLLR
ncbi:4-(cytidine 5'-diphospho)-2-C-methyl-D-erythritol kinase [Croceicoccus naphthovorans]|uniref:4-diphosphocytidyl-2-C-methyl-D-erythritol kinase n=1 Tax=Croceicoccus naphthovorans TaxID=1348774 RepID=A0A0G3XIJ7_9SPHN|nr:4-(cytidine 5'-diphospho)-2-C-methyl-D-erythritol kinase [Croceicoccus naphthovorans]AKM10441.1 4-diphosphocytidyl-2C-methyl-D-erythritol kinase [Croceicoccus naphthovorans]MBB3990155.1 4-diphosphocytidyl-2-C-methyl-D-erythritol kinase [Croceicoccus naphthovorans]